jgi:hypothetical protein
MRRRATRDSSLALAMGATAAGSKRSYLLMSSVRDYFLWHSHGKWGYSLSHETTPTHYQFGYNAYEHSYRDWSLLIIVGIIPRYTVLGLVPHKQLEMNMNQKTATFDIVGRQDERTP